MMKRIKLLFASISTVVLFTVFMVPTATFAAEIQGNICHGSDQLNLNEGGSGSCNTASIRNSQETLNDKIAKVINILSLIVGIVAVIMIIFAGFRYITSGGNEQSVAGAKKTLVYAIIGLVIAALAQILVRFVLRKTT